MDVKHRGQPVSHALFSGFGLRAPRRSGEHCCGIFQALAFTTPGCDAAYFVDASALVLRRPFPLLL